MVNYQNGKIYKIEDVGGNMCYIGSTTKDLLSKRMVEHRSKYKIWMNDNEATNYSVFNIFELYGIENCRIILVEVYPCQTKDELTSREAHFIKTMECVNKVIIGRTKAQWATDNHDKLSEARKQYKQDNPEKVKQGKALSYIKNKENIIIAQKLYYAENIAKITAHKAMITDCECGKSYTHSNKSRHMKLGIHLNYVANQTIDI